MRPASSASSGGDDLQRLRHAADAGFAALRHLAGVRPDETRRRRRRAARDCAASPCSPTSAGSSPARAGSSCRWRAAPREARSSAWPFAIFAIRSAVAGATTIRSVSRASRIWPTSNSLLRVEQVGERMLAGERADRQRRDELLRRLRQDHAHRGAALAQPADQVERFVGRDAAADDEQDARGAGLGAAAGLRCAGRRRSAADANASPSAAALRRMVRTSSSTERPFWAARSRSCFFSFSSSWRTVRLAMRA